MSGRTMGQLRYVRLGVAVGVLIAALAGPSAVLPASSDTFGGCTTDEGCRPDNFTHAYCYDGSFTSTALRSAATYALQNLDAQTAFARQANGTTCLSTTDVIFVQFSSAGSSLRGDYLCLARNGAGECERARVRLNAAVLTDTANRQKTACHEVGHSGGLRHDGGTTDCMISGLVPSGSSYQHYSSHHVSHLNAQN